MGFPLTFPFQRLFMKIWQSDYSESYSIELEPLTSLLHNHRIWNFGIYGITKYALSDLYCGGRGELYNCFKVTKNEAWNSKNCE